MSTSVELSDDELALVCSALEAYEYWELGSGLPRRDGLVFIPGDSLADSDPYWTDDPDAGEREFIDRIRRCRSLAARFAAERRLSGSSD